MRQFSSSPGRAMARSLRLHTVRLWLPGGMRSAIGLCTAVGAALVLGGCGQTEDAPLGGESAIDSAPPVDVESVPEFLEMGGPRSVTSFFITSTGVERGGDLGGLVGADAHCQTLATAEYAGDHTWRAYLSTMGREDEPAVNARDRIGTGPWHNAEGLLVAATSCALGFSWTLDCERVLAGGVSR